MAAASFAYWYSSQYFSSQRVFCFVFFESSLAVSDSLWPHGLYSPWNCPARRGSLSLLQGIFPTQGSTQVSHIVGGFFTSWATREAQEYRSEQTIVSQVDLPNPGIEPGSPALQADSVSTELSGKSFQTVYQDNPVKLKIKKNKDYLSLWITEYPRRVGQGGIGTNSPKQYQILYFQ